ncbi:hypothetical protein A5784_16770 [Mycobacterium sp. 852013-50091_SCH5140682]|nr:hypothetical protein A5784_16770 [Mycobacterium sp. 852013-50091_SCH5140682]
MHASVEAIADRLRDAGGNFIADPSHTTSSSGGALLRFEVTPITRPREWFDSCEQIDGFTLQSVGTSLEIVKDVGAVGEVVERHSLAEFVGTHGIAHTRMASESAISTLSAHPFWVRPILDTAVIHNGQLTNYRRLGRDLSRHGYRLTTDNDTEVIAALVAGCRTSGSTLPVALKHTTDRIDGAYAIVVADPQIVAVASDNRAEKPLVSRVSTDAMLMASEHRAVVVVSEDNATVFHDQPDAVTAWPVPAASETSCVS